MTVPSVPSLAKEFGFNETVSSPDDRPRATSQDMSGRFFRRIASAGLSVEAIDQKDSKLFLGSIELLRDPNVLEGEQDIVGLKMHLASTDQRWLLSGRFRDPTLRQPIRNRR
ncbi:hypothetical protein [Bradyrhizobium japonicum]|uniref:hypothetical protein n=1 Tax=Bradyrhizobium japonicum TaxID=375 RepID=UPI002714A7BF|nr:hypothetical protein [Bradyrhizobium japonicum]WLB53906.1 hypothetical protein QIH94_43005 [Bradyrhizobium japonicum]WLB64221.1 hypothetical protein QIH96_02785 [Bradyrhizobium japonicum]